MKHRSGLLMALAVAMGLAVVAGIAFAQATVTPYTLTETPGSYINPGTVTLPDGNMHLRGVERFYDRVSTNPRVNGGTCRAVLNANLDKTMAGPVWGSFHWEIGGGVWEGTWQGRFSFATGVGSYESVGHGSGDFRGLQLKEQCVYTGAPSATCTGRILKTPN